MRYAVYYAPDIDDPLHALASQWLGRDAASGETVAIPDLLPAEMHRELVADPARYGFHATLKAPFRLADGATEDDLDAAVDALAGRVGAARIPVLSLRRMDRFFALVPAVPSEAPQDLASRVVTELDDLRAPLNEDERRRLGADLTGRQHRNLERWGYPYVLDEFRFHMTLTGPVPGHRADRVEEALTAHFEPVIGRSLVVDRLCVFVEPAPGEPFRLAGTHEIRRPHGAGVVRVEAL